MPSAAQVLARYRYADGHRIDNITDWGLDQFRGHYEGGKALKHRITKDAIFQYVYGVLHDPLYREKYALNLKREFPRVPFHADFWKWAEWGEKLMALHVGYETLPRKSMAAALMMLVFGAIERSPMWGAPSASTRQPSGWQHDQCRQCKRPCPADALGSPARQPPALGCR